MSPSPHRPRVLSLVPSATEIVYALGRADCLVGRSHECDYPPAVRALPACTAFRIDPKAASGDIDRSVAALQQQAQSLYTLDVGLIAKLQPDVILVQGQCPVCAVDPSQVEAALVTMATQPQIVALATASVADLWSNIRDVGLALDAVADAERLIDVLRARLDTIAAQARDTGPSPSVACLEWLDPLISSGNWIPELVTLAGGHYLFGEPGGVSVKLAWERLAAGDPEVLVIMACGFDIPRSRRELGALSAHPHWRTLRAVRERRVFLTDGNLYFNRPSPHLIESLEILSEILHPRAPRFGHEGRGWERVT